MHSWMGEHGGWLVYMLSHQSKKVPTKSLELVP